jgi:hypothetical protein
MLPPEITERLADLNPEAILFEPRELYDSAIIGLTNQPKDNWTRTSPSPWVAIYDYDLLVKSTIQMLGPDTEESKEYDIFEAAQEWVDFNILGLWAGDGTPMIKAFDPDEDEDIENDDMHEMSTDEHVLEDEYPN